MFTVKRKILGIRIGEKKTSDMKKPIKTTQDPN